MLSNKKVLCSGVLVAVLLFTTGCDSLLATLRSGYAASRPFIQSLVDSNTIPQETANNVLGDISDSINALSQGDACVKDIPDTVKGAEKKVAKAKCYYTAAKTLETILARHNFDGNEWLTRVKTIAEGAIAALEEYYRSVSGSFRAAVGGASEDAEKKLKEKLKDAEQKFKDLRTQLNK